MLSQDNEVHCTSELPGTGSHLVPIPNARMWLVAPEPSRVRIQGKFRSLPPLLNPRLRVWGQGLCICISIQLFSPSTLPPSCSKLLPGGPLIPCLLFHLPGGLGVALTKFSLLLNPETSLTLSHRVFQRLSLRKHSPPCPPGQGLASWGRLVTVLLSQAQAGAHGLRLTQATGAEQGRAEALCRTVVLFVMWGHICPRPRCSSSAVPLGD